MSEIIDRLIARTESDMKRRVPFEVGMRHFTELVRTAISEITRKVDRIEELENRRKK